jgi:hypothetical protein
MSKKFQPLKNYLQNSVEFATIQAKLQQNQALLRLILEQLPTPLAGHCVGLAIKPEQLILFADSSAWASRLRYFTRELENNLRKNDLFFKKITIKVAIDNRKPAPKSKKRGSRLLSAENSDQLQRIARHMPDPELQAALMRLSSHKQN